MEAPKFIGKTAILNPQKEQQLLQNLQINDAELLYKGSQCKFDVDTFFDQCKGIAPTLLVVKTSKGRVWGGYTDIPWKNNNEVASGNGNSFVYTFNDNQITVFKHQGEGKEEVWHKTNLIFSMKSPAIDGDRGLALLGIEYGDQTLTRDQRRTVLCGEMMPDLDEVEIFKLK